MHCSKCGLQVVPDQKFCRSCGATLQMITQPLAELAAIPNREGCQQSFLKMKGKQGITLRVGDLLSCLSV